LLKINESLLSVMALLLFDSSHYYTATLTILTVA